MTFNTVIFKNQWLELQSTMYEKCVKQSKILHIALCTGYSYSAISKRLDITTLKLILKFQRFFETITGKAENVYFAHERTFLSQCDGSTDILQIFQPIINIIIVNQHVL